jgi:hypothetical protein
LPTSENCGSVEQSTFLTNVIRMYDVSSRSRSGDGIAIPVSVLGNDLDQIAKGGGSQRELIARQHF